MTPRAVIVLAATDFDPTESAVTWERLVARGVEVRFATPEGAPAQCDQQTLRGGWRGPLRASRAAAATYRRMAASDAFRAPLAWSDVAMAEYGALVLPGGHAPGIRPYLESPVVQGLAAGFLADGRVVGAICHGVLVVARAGLVGERRVTTLTKPQERIARWWSLPRTGRRFRTYPQYTEAEVRAAGGIIDRGSLLRGGHVIVDGTLVTARVPDDAAAFAGTLADLLC